MKKFASGYLSGALTAFVFTGAFAALAQTKNDAGHTFDAPFRVVGEKGTILSVEERAGGGVMVLHGNNGATMTLGANRDVMAVDIRSSPTEHASLIVSKTETVLSLESGKNGLLLQTNAKETGISIDRGDVEVAHFGQKAGKDAALRIFSASGTPSVELGSAAGSGGAGSLRVLDESGKIAGFMQGTEGRGGNAGVAVDGKIVVLLAVTPSNSGGKIETSDSGGEVVFRAGAKTDGGGAMCIYTDDGDRCYGPYLP